VTIFPRYINRPWCDLPGTFATYDLCPFCILYISTYSLPGKCDICYEIDTLRRSSQDKETQEQLNIANHLYRGGMFNLERLKYKRRAAEAIKSNSGPRPTVMSLIIDGMDQSHCKCPYLGSQSTFSKPISQHIVGVKEHGVGLTLFRHFNNVSKSADVTIYCILRKLEEFLNVMVITQKSCLYKLMEVVKTLTSIF